MKARLSKADKSVLAKLKLNLTRSVTSLQDRHALGQLVDTWYGKESGRAYGQGRLKRLKQELGLSDTQIVRLDRYRRFYQLYPTAKSVATLDDNGLTWSYVRLLISVKDDEQRAQLAKAAVAEQWTARDLQRRIQETIGIRKHKRQPVEADDIKIVGPISAVSLIHSQAKWWIQNQTTLARQLGRKPTKAEDDVARQRMSATREELAAMVKTLPTLLRHLDQRLAACAASDRPAKN